jgi:hypothetical protein
MGIAKESSLVPNWLPDWTDIKQYPDPEKDKIPSRVWAWEFLRRNPKYQQLWNKYAELPPGPVYSGPTARAFWDICERFEREFGIKIPAPPAMTITDPEFQWRPRFITQNPRHWTLPINFSVDGEFEMPAIDLEDPAEVVVKFDVRSQIKPQLNYAAKLLKAEVKRLTDAELLGGEPRARVDKFQNYLRVLDAKSSGITNRAIAVEILGIDNPNNPNNPENQKDMADFAFKSAKRLRDGGYRFLAAMG